MQLPPQPGDFRTYAQHDGTVWEAAPAVVLRIRQSVGTWLHVLHTQTGGWSTGSGPPRR